MRGAFSEEMALLPHLRSWFQRLRDLAHEGRSLLQGVVADSALDPFPLKRSLHGYGKRSFLADLRAGVSVALLDIPQGMAYALIAGLPLQYGITCSAVASLVSGGCIVSGASIKRTILSPNVRVNSFTVLEEAVVLPSVHIHRNAHLKKVVIDTSVVIPEGLVVGEDPELDAKRFRRTASGICLITQPMIDRLTP